MKNQQLAKEPMPKAGTAHLFLLQLGETLDFPLNIAEVNCAPPDLSAEWFAGVRKDILL